MQEYAQESTIQTMEASYPPSWIDRLIVWIERIPGPTWLFYVLSALGAAVGFHAVFWLDGALQLGSMDSFLTANGIILIYWIALYHHLTYIGSQSLQTFRPLLEVDDSRITEIDYELATLPRRFGWLSIPLGIGFWLTELIDPAPYGNLVPRTALPIVFDLFASTFLISSFVCLAIRSIRQLRMVRKLHIQAANINLLELGPAHAFSVLTARTGIGVILLLILAIFLDPTPGETGFDILGTVSSAILAVAIFVLPVMGIRDRIEEEKQRALKQTSSLLLSARDDLHSKVSRRAYDEFKGIEDSINALIRDRELLGNIPTWPWEPATIRGFASALVLPIFLWLVTRLLEGFL